MTLSVTDTDAGAEGVTLSLMYTTAAPFQASSWIYVTVPKANKFYDTGLNIGSAISLTTNLSTATFTLGAGSFSIVDNELTLGSNYDDDVWAFKIVDTATAADAEEDIVLTILITNPPCVYNLVDSWAFTIKTELPDPSCASTPSSCADVESANEAPLDPDGLITLAYRENTASNEMSISGTLDGIGVTGATYEFKLRNNNMIPEEGVMIITVPTAVTVTDSASSFVLACSLGCNTGNSPAFSWNAALRKLTVTNAFVGAAVAASDNSEQGVFFTIEGWTNPNDSSTHDFYIETSFLDGGVTYRSIEYFSGLQITAKQGLC